MIAVGRGGALAHQDVGEHVDRVRPQPRLAARQDDDRIIRQVIDGVVRCVEPALGRDDPYLRGDADLRRERRTKLVGIDGTV